MLFLEITSAVTALTLLVLAACLIPVLRELMKTAVSVRSVAESLQLEIKPLVQELRDTIAEVQVVTSTAADHAEGLNILLEELGHAGRNIRTINKVMGVASTLASGSSAWVTGVRVAGKFIADRLIKKRG